MMGTWKVEWTVSKGCESGDGPQFVPAPGELLSGPGPGPSMCLSEAWMNMW